MARKAPRSKMEGRLAEPARMLRVAEELEYDALQGCSNFMNNEQLTPTKIYHACETQTHQADDTLSKFCRKTAESIPYVLASWPALAQNKYLARHNAALKVLFWEMLN